MTPKQTERLQNDIVSKRCREYAPATHIAEIQISCWSLLSATSHPNDWRAKINETRLINRQSGGGPSHPAKRTQNTTKNGYCASEISVHESRRYLYFSFSHPTLTLSSIRRRNQERRRSRIGLVFVGDAVARRCSRPCAAPCHEAHSTDALYVCIRHGDACAVSAYGLITRSMWFSLLAATSLVALVRCAGNEYLPPNKGYNYEPPKIPFPTPPIRDTICRGHFNEPKTPLSLIRITEEKSIVAKRSQRLHCTKFMADYARKQPESLTPKQNGFNLALPGIHKLRKKKNNYQQRTAQR
ncbi:hypothetical protein EVAR_90419_1 [Eumeta japonica]|uniref:Uncharacterized protein n=1 Tax=Eumeta variegata TaxID=151549 RepID=A0A4C1YAD4_EUMVA|nr:hypothetical protein EVAR_90419_1 [Eumeta japonica]